jgi:hypothetical protein
LCEVPLESELLKADAVEPPLTVINAASRFVFVPATQFESEGVGGWVAKVKSVSRGRDQATQITFKDADGKISSHYFMFEHVLAAFKPLS